jgi:hypothetical protein
MKKVLSQPQNIVILAAFFISEVVFFGFFLISLQHLFQDFTSTGIIISLIPLLFASAAFIFARKFTLIFLLREQKRLERYDLPNLDEKNLCNH